MKYVKYFKNLEFFKDCLFGMVLSLTESALACYYYNIFLIINLYYLNIISLSQNLQMYEFKYQMFCYRVIPRHVTESPLNKFFSYLFICSYLNSRMKEEKFCQCADIYLENFLSVCDLSEHVPDGR